MAVRHALAADVLLINGRVLTLDGHDTVAQAVAVRDGKIVAVGSTEEVEPLAGAATQVIDLDGRTALPGLTDVARGSPLADFRLPERRLPTREELDHAAPRNPTYISFGAHVIIANTLACARVASPGTPRARRGARWSRTR